MTTLTHKAMCNIGVTELPTLVAPRAGHQLALQRSMLAVVWPWPALWRLQLAASLLSGCLQPVLAGSTALPTSSWLALAGSAASPASPFVQTTDHVGSHCPNHEFCHVYSRRWSTPAGPSLAQGIRAYSPGGEPAQHGH